MEENNNIMQDNNTNTNDWSDWADALNKNSNTESVDQVLQTQPPNEEVYDEEQDEKQSLFKRVRGSFWWTVIRTVLAIIIIAVGTYLILYLVARAAKYETISAMLQSMFIELELMWQRILY